MRTAATTPSPSGKDPYSDDLKASYGNGGILTYTSDETALGRTTITFDSTKLPEDWGSTWGQDEFTFKYNCGSYDESRDTSLNWDSEAEYVTVTIANVSNVSATYGISVKMGADSYDLTREYSTDSSDWTFANPVSEDFSGTATATVELSSLKGGYDVGAASFGDISSVELSLTDGKTAYTCSASYDGSWTNTNGNSVTDGKIGYMSIDDEDGVTTLSVVLAENPLSYDSKQLATGTITVGTGKISATMDEESYDLTREYKKGRERNFVTIHSQF